MREGEREKKGGLSLLPAAPPNVSPREHHLTLGDPGKRGGERACVFRLEIVFIPLCRKSRVILIQGQTKCMFCTCHTRGPRPLYSAPTKTTDKESFKKSLFSENVHQVSLSLICVQNAFSMSHFGGLCT